MAAKNLKLWNLPVLCSLIALDIFALYFLLNPEALSETSFTKVAAARLSLSLSLPVVVLLLAAVLPANLKATLVYWRFRHALPGHRAFTTYGPSDNRVNMVALQRNVGTLPTDPREQNALWYKLFRRVDAETVVQAGHQAVLLFRKMSSISFLLAIAVPLTLLALDVRINTVAIVLAVFLIQYLLATLAARNNGVRFVGTVLAEHSIRRVPAVQAKAAK